MKYLSLSFLVWVVVANLVVGCQSAKDDQILKAQLCLDQAQTASQAANCASMLSGLSGERVQRLLCGITAIEDGLTQSAIVNAFSAINTPGQDPILEIGVGLGLPDLNGDGHITTPVEVAAAQNLQAICNQTSSVGLKLAASLVVFATQAKAATDAAAGNPNDPNALATNIGNMTDADAGNFAINTFSLYCVPTYQSDKICATLKTAGANNPSNVTSVGSALKACLHTNTCQ